MTVSELLEQRYVPLNWWESFKEGLPGWFKNKWPVRYKIESRITSEELSEWAAFFSVEKEDQDKEDAKARAKGRARKS